MRIRNIDKDIDRVLTLLRNRIRERGYTQLEVQNKLGWGRSYISQLLTKQKAIRLDQVLMILKVIDAEPAEFWAEMFHFGSFGEHHPGRPHRTRAPSGFPDSDGVDSSLDRIRILYDCIVMVLTRKGLISSADLEAAIARAEKHKD